MKTFRILLALTFILIVTGAGAETLIRSTYKTSYIGLPVSTATITLRIDENAYDFTGTGRASAFASLFGRMDAELKAKGHFSAGAMKPESFDAKIAGKKDTYVIALEFKNGRIAKETSLPKRDKPPKDFVPVADAMKHGVIDPMSAFLIPLKTSSIDEVCKRTLPIYTGRERFDIVLAPARTEQVSVPGLYEGEAFVCSGRYRPLGGHRSEKPEVKYMIENTDMEVWFVPLPGTRALGLYKVSIGTKLGYVTVELTKASILNEPPAQGENKNKPKKS